MDKTLPQAMSPSELAPVNGPGATPFSQQTVVLTTQVDIEKQPPDKYVRRLPPPPEDSSGRGRGTSEAGDDGAGFFGGPLP